jgi:hypothetical protein
MIQATNAQQSLWSDAAAPQAFPLPGLASGTTPERPGAPFAVSAANEASGVQLSATQKVNKKKRGRGAVGAGHPEPEGEVGGAAHGPTQPPTGTRSSRRVALRSPGALASGEGNKDAAASLGAVGTTSGDPAPQEEEAASPAAAKRCRPEMQTVFTHDEAVAAFAEDAKWDDVGLGLRHAHGCKCCGKKKTTQWRSGPGGPQTLCNACGVRWSGDSKRAANAALNWPELPQR